MSTIAVFLAGLLGTMGIVLAALVYMRNPLFSVLADVCGTADRARFWTAFSNVTLFLVPFAFALSARPDAKDWPEAVFEIGSQIEWAIIGFVVSVLVLGFVLASDIGRARRLETTAARNAPR